MKLNEDEQHHDRNDQLLTIKIIEEIDMSSIHQENTKAMLIRSR